MSHFKERKENNCLNCNAIVHDRFCGVCGQENIEPKESAWHLTKHFFEDITHFDGKFFSSLKYLIFKPGFLSSEYVRGRRMAYLNPIRFYIFTSFVFFFFIFFIADSRAKEKELNYVSENKDGSRDSAKVSFNEVLDSISNTSDSTPIEYQIGSQKGKSSAGGIYFSKYNSKKEYDSLVVKGVIKGNFFNRFIEYKQISLGQKYNRDMGKVNMAIKESYLRNLPLLFLFSIPFFALFLKLIYLRKRNKFFVGHAIFAIHIYIFNFIVILIMIGIKPLKIYVNYGFFQFVQNVVGIYMVYYWYRAIRNFYQQGILKSLLKYLLIACWLFFILMILLLIFFFYSLIKL